jgi:hypothetical protein
MLHRDGWVGPRLRVRARPGMAELRIDGELPDYCPLAGQELTVRVGGAVLLRSRVGRGAFELRVPWAPADPREAEVRAERYFVPALLGFPGRDRRRLSWRASRVSWA